jgi:putative membrane protein
MGRTCWSDVIRSSRTLGRLFWFHVPPRLTAKTPEEIQTGLLQRSTQEMNKVMSEKIMALDLIEGSVIVLFFLHMRNFQTIFSIQVCSFP